MNSHNLMLHTWMEIFTETFGDDSHNGPEELRKVIILFYALKNEMNNVKAKLDREISDLYKKVEEKQALELKVNDVCLKSPKPKPNFDLDKENISPKPIQEIGSPDVFGSPETLKTESFDFLSSSYENQGNAQSQSPILAQKSRKPYRKKEVTPKNVFNNSKSIIENTPDDVTFITSINKSKMNKMDEKNKRANKQSLTQMFANMRDSPAGNSRSISRSANNSNSSSNKDTRKDTPSTSLQELGITEILDLISPKSSPKKVEDDDETFIDEDELLYHNPVKKSKPQSLKVYPTIRGKARRNLPAWSCRECKNFYEGQNLTEEELRRKIAQCSRHRGNKPLDETREGYWDLTIKSP